MAPATSRPAAAPAAPYPRLLKPFLFYAEYHHNTVNQWIHIACVPLLVATGCVLLGPLNATAALPAGLRAAAEAALKRPLPAVSAATLTAGAYSAFYLYLTGGRPLGWSATAMIAGLCAGAHGFTAALGGFQHAWRPAAALHVVSWLAQFYGHGVHEKRAPALLDNLGQALFMAPLFVLMEVGFKVGLLRDFQRAVEPEVASRVRAFKAGSKDA